MPQHDAASLRERQTETSHVYDDDDRRGCRGFLSVGCETMAMTRVPPLDWPADLFVGCQASEAEATI